VRLLDVNALVALAWDSHVHHAVVRQWFRAHADDGWATCAVTEAGFVRVSSNAKALPTALPVDATRGVLRALRGAGLHRFLANDVSLCDPDVPPIVGHRQVTDAVLLTVARRAGARLLTFDGGVAALADGEGVELLQA
jgi:toxin-antitoxin system PIN domain toxin